LAPRLKFGYHEGYLVRRESVTECRQFEFGWHP
jgi:hypothetical protein